MSKVVDYIPGLCRNEQHKVRSHTYALTAAGNYWPMCDYGWNRSDGERFSIFRGHVSTRGHCKICEQREAAGLRPIFRPRPHKTKWL